MGTFIIIILIILGALIIPGLYFKSKSVDYEKIQDNIEIINNPNVTEKEIIYNIYKNIKTIKNILMFFFILFLIILTIKLILTIGIVENIKEILNFKNFI